MREVRGIASTKMTYAEDFWRDVVKDRAKDYDDIDDYTVLGIITKVRFGTDDHGVCLSFNVMIDESSGSLNVLFYPAYDWFLKMYGVSDVKDLTGKPVWMLKDKHILTVLKPAIF